LKLACWFWRRRFLKTLLKCIFIILLLSPLGQGRFPSFEQFRINPLPLRMICVKSGKNWPSGSGEEVQNVKVYRQTDNMRYDFSMSNKRKEIERKLQIIGILISPTAITLSKMVRSYPKHSFT
jgi:hypothetical protein